MLSVDMTQEEDFVSNLYNRKLLGDFDTEDVQKLIDEACIFTEQQASLNDALLKAILTRLTLRKRMLVAVESDLHTEQQAQIRQWTHCSELLPGLLQTHKFGEPVGDAFSIKIQRTLASSIPPRPMVETNFEEVHTFLGNLCRDAADAFHVLNYHGSNNMLVPAQDPPAVSAR